MTCAAGLDSSPSSVLPALQASASQTFPTAEEFGLIPEANLGKTFLAHISFPPEKMKTEAFFPFPALNVPSSSCFSVGLVPLS